MGTTETTELNPDVPAAAPTKPRQAGRPRKPKAAAGSGDAAASAFSAVQIRGEYHRRLSAIADRKESATGARVTLTGLVEDALRRVYPKEFEGADGAATSGAAGAAAVASAPVKPLRAKVGGFTGTAEITGDPPRVVSSSIESNAESVFNEILTAALCQDSDIASTEAINALDGAVQGSLGQAIRVRDLAFYMRSADPVACPIDELADLIAAYEAGL